MAAISLRYSPILKKAIYDLNTCMDKILSIYDISPVFMAYEDIYIRTLYNGKAIDMTPLISALESIYCINNPGIVKYMDCIEIHVIRKDISNWDGIDPISVQFWIHVKDSMVDALIREYPSVKFSYYTNGIYTLEQIYNLYVANSLGITQVKDRIRNCFMKHLTRTDIYQEDQLIHFYSQFFEYVDNMVVATKDIWDDYESFIDTGMVGMTIFNERAYQIPDFDSYLGSLDFIVKLKLSKVIKIDTSNIDGITSTPQESSIYFVKLIHSIAKCAMNLVHFEINYTLDMNHCLFLDEGTRNSMMEILQRCNVVLIRGKFTFGDHPWIINLNQCPKICRFDLDNLNDKAIRINASTNNTYLFSLTMCNNVYPLDLNKSLNFIEMKHSKLSKYILSILSDQLEVIDLEGSMDSKTTIDLSKFPKLHRMSLNLKGNSLYLSTSQPHSKLKRLMVSDVVTFNIETPQLSQFMITSSHINQEMIDNLPKSLEDISFQGTVGGAPIIDTNKFPHLGIIRLMNNMDQKFHVIGNIHHAGKGIFLVK